MSAQFGGEKIAVDNLALRGGEYMVKRVKVKGRPVWKRLPLLLLLLSY